MDIKWIEDFLHLVETQNFSLAAERRFVTQSAYSRRIKALEEWVGAELFDRSKLPIQVTPQGQEFLPYAESLLSELNQIQAKFRDSNSQRRREMCIITLHSLMLHFMPDMFKGFDFAGTKINVTSSLTGFDSYFDQITSGGADLFVSYEVKALADRLSELGYIGSAVVGREEIVPVLSKELATQINWDTARRIPRLALNRGSFIAAIVEQGMSPYEHRFETVYETNLTESLLVMARQGQGVALLPYSVCRHDLEQGRLCLLEGPDLGIRPNVMAYVNKKKATRSTQLFVEHMKRVSCDFARA